MDASRGLRLGHGQLASNPPGRKTPYTSFRMADHAPSDLAEFKSAALIRELDHEAVLNLLGWQ